MPLPVPPVQDQPHCPSCGAQLRKQQPFCPFCGARTDEPAPPAPAPVQETAALSELRCAIAQTAAVLPVLRRADGRSGPACACAGAAA
ncbi:MAG: zinc-ribbon domain-containing protein [Acutalibacteraceae bacterium]